MNSRRFYIAPVGGISITEQEGIARQQGLKDDGPRHLDSKKSFPQQLRKAFDSLRAQGRDEHIWVSDFVVIVQRKKYLRPALDQLKKKNAYIYEGRTGRRSDRPADYTSMLHDAIDYWGKGRLPHHLAVSYGREGGEEFARMRRKNDKRMPKGEAIKYWRDPKYSTATEAIDAINSHRGYSEEWTRSSAYRSLGERQLPSGPRGPRK